MRHADMSNQYPTDVIELVKRLAAACGYEIDVAVVMRALSGDVFELHVFDTGKFGTPDRYDDDMFETVSRGQGDRIMGERKVWLYGHAGFDILHVTSTGGYGDDFRYLMSEQECFNLFYDDLLGGYLNKVLPRLPKIGSEEELRLWLAAAAV